MEAGKRLAHPWCRECILHSTTDGGTLCAGRATTLRLENGLFGSCNDTVPTQNLVQVEIFFFFLENFGRSGTAGGNFQIPVSGIALGPGSQI